MGKANIVLAYTRMKKIFVKQGKIPLFHHHFRLCFEVDRNRSTRVDLLRPIERAGAIPALSISPHGGREIVSNRKLPSHFWFVGAI